MNYEPYFVEANEVKRISLATAKHTAILLDNILNSGSVMYRFILRVIENDTQKPCFYVTAEMLLVGAVGEQVLGAMWNRWDEVEKVGEVSYFIGVFPGDGHESMLCSPKWRNRDLFEKVALEIAEKRLA